MKLSFINYQLVLHQHKKMKVHHNILELPQFERAVLTIGTFDGVHLGHRKIIEQLVNEANRVKGTSIVLTFFPHPKHVVGNNDEAVLLLNTLEEKVKLLSEAGVDHLVVTPFTMEFAELSAENYIKDFLVKSFNPYTLIIGYDHRFGKNRIGDFNMLHKYSTEFGYNVMEVPEHILAHIKISSTQIRKQLLLGNVEQANEILGYNYFFSGIVIDGEKRGRTIGFPTANLQISDTEKLIPANGVYAIDVTIEDTKIQYEGMMNMGIKPTFNGQEKSIEVNIFDFNEMIYGKKLTIFLKLKIRDEMKFDSVEALVSQLNKDREKAKGF
jgi:riboflavin kinase/FMN adenylyltransferase